MFVIWLLFCVGVGYMAQQKGKNAFLWFGLSLIISPLLTGVILALQKDDKQAEQIEKTNMEQQQLRERVAVNEKTVDQRMSNLEKHVQQLDQKVDTTMQLQQQQQTALLNAIPNLQLAQNATKTCPSCGQVIKQGALKCRFCGADIKTVKMIPCPVCQEIIRADSDVCKYCHSPLH